MIFLIYFSEGGLRCQIDGKDGDDWRELPSKTPEGGGYQLVCEK
jgi:hypothetical protein